MDPSIGAVAHGWQHNRHKKEKAHNNILKSKVAIRAKAVFLRKTNHILFSALALSLCFRAGLPPTRRLVKWHNGKCLHFFSISFQYMKQFLLLFFSALLTLGADAQTRTFTDNLVVDMGGTTGTTAPLTATVYLTEHDGKVDLELRNFVFKTPTVNTAVGHIKLSDLTVTEDGEKKRFSGKGKAKLTRGDLPGYFFWMSSLLSSLDMEADGYFTADSLNFALDFTVPIQGKMKVKYGRWTTTGVQTAVSAPADEAVYTLGGRRLPALPARGGVYIVGGRKVVR